MVDVAIVRCEEYNKEVYSAVAKALDLINANEILKKGMKVLIKPNILCAEKPEKAVTTHPYVIGAICKYIEKIGAKAYIGEASGVPHADGTDLSFRVSGIEAIAKKMNVEFINFDKDKKVMVKIDDAFILKNIPLSRKLSEMDVIIDACKLKTHMLTGYTGAVKNMFGILPGRTKNKVHVIGKDIRDFSNILLDVYSAAKPKICIMDAIVGMEGDGPQSGKPKKTGLIFASREGIALDMIASRIIGFKFEDLTFLKVAKKRKLIPENIKVINIKEIPTINYKKPVSYRIGHYRGLLNILVAVQHIRLYADTDKCKACGICAKKCPQKAITVKNYAKFDHDKCILCYCCHELCQYDAIVPKQPLYLRIMDRLIKTIKYIQRKIS